MFVFIFYSIYEILYVYMIYRYDYIFYNIYENETVIKSYIYIKVVLYVL